jgi:hypothetical protein
MTDNDTNPPILMMQNPCLGNHPSKKVVLCEDEDSASSPLALRAPNFDDSEPRQVMIQAWESENCTACTERFTDFWFEQSLGDGMPGFHACNHHFSGVCDHMSWQAVGWSSAKARRLAFTHLLNPVLAHMRGMYLQILLGAKDLIHFIALSNMCWPYGNWCDWREEIFSFDV